MNARGNHLWLEMHCEEGRGKISIDLGAIGPANRLTLIRLLKSAGNSKRVHFALGQAADDSAQIMQFAFVDIVATPIAAENQSATQ